MNSRRPKGQRLLSRWHEFSLWAVFVLIAIAAGFFCVVSKRGYVDGITILLAIIVLAGAVQLPRHVHLTTAALLTLLTGMLLWANLRPTGWQGEIGLATPTELDPITKAMFWRGWPLSPCVLCLVHGMKFHPGREQWALVFDGVFFVVAIFGARVVCERRIRWRKKNTVGGTITTG